MADIEERLRETARSLLSEGKVELVIGYRQGTLPMRTTPCFARTLDEASALVWNRFCANSLARYLRGIQGRVAVVAKACDARAIAVFVAEKQIPRENVLLIGVPCDGVVDRGAVERRLRGREVLTAGFQGQTLVLHGNGSEERLGYPDYLGPECLSCHVVPDLWDVVVGDAAVPGRLPERDEVVASFEALPAEERWAYVSEAFATCIRCYACRQACPLCYCAECVLDQTQPRWVGKSDDISDILTFHIVRALHVAGRCVGCGACSRACPLGLPLHLLNHKLAQDVRDLYNYEAGSDFESPPALGAFAPDDPQEFIR